MNGATVPARGKRILVVDDDEDIARLVELHLRDLGFHVELAFDGRSGLETALASPPDLIVLDLMLPGIDGLDVCRHLRESGRYVPLLMLTAKSTELDRVLGLEMGADDYLAKPFSIVELVARVKAIFRRVEAIRRAERSDAEHEQIRTGPLTIDIARRTVTLAERPVALTAREFDLLVHFARHPGRVYSRSQLLDSVWGYGHDGYEHTVNSHINRLRAKIEDDPARPRFILTVWGVGYKFAESAAVGE